MNLSDLKPLVSGGKCRKCGSGVRIKRKVSEDYWEVRCAECEEFFYNDLGKVAVVRSGEVKILCPICCKWEEVKEDETPIADGATNYCISRYKCERCHIIFEVKTDRREIDIEEIKYPVEICYV